MYVQHLKERIETETGLLTIYSKNLQESKDKDSVEKYETLVAQTLEKIKVYNIIALFLFLLFLKSVKKTKTKKKQKKKKKI